MNKIYSTPSRQKTFDNTNFSNEDTMNFAPDFLQTNQGSGAKRKSHNPLCLTSSNFMAKGVNPSMFQDSASTTFDSTDVTHSSVASEPINRSMYIQTPEHLDLNSFKIKPCPINTQHNHKHCPFYHNAKDRKRLGFFYSAELCEYAEKESISCPNGDSCQKAHNRVEQLYRPDKYKTKFCTFYPHNLEKCDYANFCSFAHNEYDITTELIHNYEYDDDFYMFHFKTVWCPFNLTQHDKALCVYAHNWQDYRRKPNVCVYDPAPCPNWKSTDFILNYEDGCCFREKCNKCHGWKELEYHPFNYKSKPCPAKNCAKGRDCPYYHYPFERRTISGNVLNRVFKYAPRNRIITNTFKVRSEERVPASFSSHQNSNPSSATFSSLVFSQDGDSFQDQFPSLTEQMLCNPPRSGTLNTVNEVPDKIFDFRAPTKPMMEEQQSTSIEYRYRKQSYDFQGPQQSIGGGGMMQPRNEFVPMGLDIKDNRVSYAKARRWSAHEDDRFNNENDKLFREIFMSSMKKETSKHDEKASPMNRNADEKEELGGDVELKNTLMLEKILESEDA